MKAETKITVAVRGRQNSSNKPTRRIGRKQLEGAGKEHSKARWHGSAVQRKVAAAYGSVRRQQGRGARVAGAAACVRVKVAAGGVARRAGVAVGVWCGKRGGSGNRKGSARKVCSAEGAGSAAAVRVVCVVKRWYSRWQRSSHACVRSGRSSVRAAGGSVHAAAGACARAAGVTADGWGGPCFGTYRERLGQNVWCRASSCALLPFRVRRFMRWTPRVYARSPGYMSQCHGI